MYKGSPSAAATWVTRGWGMRAWVERRCRFTARSRVWQGGTRNQRLRSLPSCVPHRYGYTDVRAYSLSPGCLPSRSHDRLPRRRPLAVVPVGVRHDVREEVVPDVAGAAAFGARTCRRWERHVAAPEAAVVPDDVLECLAARPYL
eukprot:scaffold48708_cov63-Phaeocystis_antarctica.AAC.2